MKLVQDRDKPLVWLRGGIKTPPFSDEARRNAGFLLRLLQRGMLLSMPVSRPMPSIGPRCHELRVEDARKRIAWRIIYRIDEDAILIGDIFAKKTQATPKNKLDECRRRFAAYDDVSKRGGR
jgi:phage-related protein